MVLYLWAAVRIKEHLGRRENSPVPLSTGSTASVPPPSAPSVQEPALASPTSPRQGQK